MFLLNFLIYLKEIKILAIRINNVYLYLLFENRNKK